MSRVLNVLGRSIVLFAPLYLLPLAVSAGYRDGALLPFLAGALTTLVVGASILWGTSRFSRELKARDGFLLVVLALSAMALLASLPLAWNEPDLSWTDAIFESVAGLTTTNASVLFHLDTLPPSINLWRSLLQWIGGLGTILLAVAVLPTLGVGGRQWYRAETLGPLKGAQVVTRLIQATKMFSALYVGLTCVCAIALQLAGMSVFDAVAHALTTVSLGGFSSHDESIRYFNSPAIEAVLIVFMLGGSLNFVTHFLALRRLSLRPYREDKEATGTLLLVVGSVVGMTLFLVREDVIPDFGLALRQASFNVISLSTTSGFVSADYTKWPPFAFFWMLFLGCLSAGSGSPGGGIKMFRSLILVRQAFREIRGLVHPSVVTTLRVGGRALSPAIVQSVLAFIFIYFITAAALIFMLLLSGLDLQTTLSAIVSCLNNIGPGLGSIGPGHTYGDLNVFQKWVCIAAMFAGRVEIFALIIVFVPAFWRK